LPIATTSSTSGIEKRPGRTGTVTVNSGLRQTKMFRLSPGPMRYSAEGSEEAGGAGGSSGAPPHPVTAKPTTAANATKKCDARAAPVQPFQIRTNIGISKILITGLRSPDIDSRPAIIRPDALYHQIVNFAM